MGTRQHAAARCPGATRGSADRRGAPRRPPPWEVRMRRTPATATVVLLLAAATALQRAGSRGHRCRLVPLAGADCAFYPVWRDRCRGAGRREARTSSGLVPYLLRSVPPRTRSGTALLQSDVASPRGARDLIDVGPSGIAGAAPARSSPFTDRWRFTRACLRSTFLCVPRLGALAVLSWRARRDRRCARCGVSSVGDTGAAAAALLLPAAAWPVVPRCGRDRVPARVDRDRDTVVWRR